MTVRETCWPPCAGCVGMGPCDLGEPCAYGCGSTASTPYGTCQRCEDEATGRDHDDEDDEGDW